ncbi:putative RecQ mediated genome instability protein [Heracleum sosnowskyi]|uniref:RecQ mediated genome instability protein n=1 Tax=Heracleum sosnowskyi TaxID=360622 RepID=A0AAD8J6T7_9APIA|nr:putative RecQ mediated genome instability protein [Heracleum sosnowskyi]
MDTSCSSSPSSPSSPSAESVMIEALIKRGWCFGDIDKVKALIVIQSALHGESSPTLDFIESELCNMDLKSIGAKSLPDSSVLRSKSARLLGPKVLQVSAARDISRSNIAESSGNSSNKRLLRLKLTDGHSEITAIEYSHIPSIPDDVIPGTKIHFEDKAIMRNGILCLNPKGTTVLGGVVQSLYEEWQMNQKYSGFSRTSVQLSNDGDTGGPPQFEKLHVGAPSRRFNQGKFPQISGLTSKSSDLAFVGKDGGSIYEQSSKLQHSVTKVENMNSNVKSDSVIERNEGKITSSESRPKEVVESIPVQNQAAAQKLLEKMNHNGRGDRFVRGGKYRGKGKFEEAPVFTLDEWEKRKASANSSMKQGIPDVMQAVGKDGGSIYGQSSKLQHSVTKVENMNSNVKSDSVIERNEGKITSSESRPKEVVESIPVQNQAAAQKLLEKMNHNGRGDRFVRGGKYRGKGKFEEAPVLTLDEWEKRKASANSSMKQGIPDVMQDEDLARQLQNQFDLEDHEQRGPKMTQADSIKLNMFSFAKDNVNDDGRTGFRGRGRGGGRGRGRGSGWGRGRGRGFRG